jgi:hypothetical protein
MKTLREVLEEARQNQVGWIALDSAIIVGVLVYGY